MTKNIAIVFRTHYVDDDLIKLAETLGKHSYKIIFAIDAKFPEVSCLSHEKFYVSPGLYKEMGLHYNDPHLLWKCGDYILYALNANYSSFDYYWIVEPDVIINIEDKIGFFKKIDTLSNDDFLSSFMHKSEDDWYWKSSMSKIYETVYRSFYPLVRVSRKAADFLYKERKNLANIFEKDENISSIGWPNDEVFTATVLKNNGYSCNDLNNIIHCYDPNHFNSFTLAHHSEIPPWNGYLYHPVRSGISYLKSAEYLGINRLSSLKQAYQEIDPENHDLANVLISKILTRNKGDNPKYFLDSANEISDGKIVEFTQIVKQTLTICYKESLSFSIVALNEFLNNKSHNIALGMPAWQSSICHHSNVNDTKKDAEGANDGNLNSIYGFHTDEESNPWWSVNLLSAYAIEKIIIYNRRTCSDRLSGFEILSSDDGFEWLNRYTHHGQVGETIEINFSQSFCCKMLRVMLPRVGILHFIEFQVFGEKKIYVNE
ncbi:galactose-binding domain-containing protein [Gluconacetobacter tumulicola]|uniref:F5/8 type C domain-containing protein n=1 Tax=Gluconacetobacter tumulicola TaxID=1017177 RepID=A0A7W4JH93_9PROT|nr:discoidin domain-containing protein [Gluconacetobacter tumulicola]MBB2181203.1 hypothetical protein [Gluconacetobacter tumulicola]